MARRIAEPLGYGGEAMHAIQAAKGVLTIANLTMSSIIKKISIARGYDPRNFALFCYGGGGPLHGIELARASENTACHRSAGARKFLRRRHAARRSPHRHRHSTFIVQLNPENLAKVEAIFRNWKPRDEGRCSANSATAWSRSIARSKCATKASTIRSRSASPRPTTPRQLRARFDQEYLRRYGHANEAAEAEIVVLHSLATLHTEAAGDRPPYPHESARQGADGRKRPVFFLEEDRFLPTDIYDRYALRAGLRRGRPGAHRRVWIEHADRSPRYVSPSAISGKFDIDCHH